LVHTEVHNSYMCTFARRKLDIPNDTHYLNMFYSTMVGVGYMHFCQQERA